MLKHLATIAKHFNVLWTIICKMCSIITEMKTAEDNYELVDMDDGDHEGVNSDQEYVNVDQDDSVLEYVNVETDDLEQCQC